MLRRNVGINFEVSF